MVDPADPLGIQGVTDAGGDPEDVAPASSDSAPESEPLPGGDPAQADEADRDGVPEKNRYKELLRKHAKMEERLQDMQIELAAQTLANERSAAPQEPEKPPYSEAELKTFLDAGEMDRWAEAREANLEWKTEQKLRQAQTHQTQAQRAQEVDRYIKKIIHVDEDSDLGQAVARRSRELQREMGGFAPEFYQLAALAEMAGKNNSESPDLRGESLSRGAARRADTSEPSGVPVETKMRFDAPNRGLDSKVISNLRRHGLEDLLVKGRDAREEADKQRRLKRFIGRYDEIQKGRARR